MNPHIRRALVLSAGIAFAMIVAVVGYAFRDTITQLPLVQRALSASRAIYGGADMAAQPEMSSSSAVDSEARRAITIEPQRQQLIGVRLATVQRSDLGRTIRATAVVRYDETRLADINVKVEGWIRELHVDYTGQPIRKGQPLFSFYSPDLLATENEYLLALKTLEQMQSSQVADARVYAQRIVEAARQRLTLWDLPAEQVRDLEQVRRAQETVTFASPVTGYVIEKQAVQGMHVMPGQTLYKVADLSTVWVEASIYEQEMSLVRVGQRATVTLDAYPEPIGQGRAVYIYPYVEENTRTMKVRFSFPNRDGRLKPGMFANIELRAPQGRGLTVPTDAVLDSGIRQTVFVATGDGNFAPRTVKVGRRLDDVVEVTEGLKEGEQVAAAATFFLDSESQLRAGLENYEPAVSSPAREAGPEQRLQITFRAQPDPPKTGPSDFEVTVKSDAGQPVPDAEVSVTLFMPAMPTMNMPAMRHETKLSHVGGGVYRGEGQLMMSGHWDVTVTVTKGTQRLGSRQFALVAR